MERERNTYCHLLPVPLLLNSHLFICKAIEGRETKKDGELESKRELERERGLDKEGQ